MPQYPTNESQLIRRSNKTNNRRQHQLDQKQHQQRLQPYSWPTTTNYLNLNYLKIVLVCIVLHLLYISQVSCQLPDDIQRELNQNLAEQARLQALRARHQQLIQARQQQQQQQQRQQPQTQGATGASAQAKPAHDPNNYSFQQVSPPIQYSYYQPYGDLAKTQQPQGAQSASGGQPNQGSTAAASGGAPQQPLNIDLNNLNIDIPNLPTPQAQTVQPGGGGQGRTQQHMTPHFTGAGGLPVLQPVAAANQSPDTFAPAGQTPLQPQAQTAGGPQQGPPLTEADFKDITGGENYGAPGGSDFGMAGGGNNQAGGEPASEPRSSSGAGGDGDSDAQLREFGMPDGQSDARQQPVAPQQRQDNSMASMMQGLGGFNPMESGGAGGQGTRQRQGGGGGGGGGFDPFGAAGFGGAGFPMGNDMGGAFGAPAARRQSRPRPAAPAGDFDFASQPSSQSQGDTAQGVMNGGAPGSLQSLLGNAFPGLSGGQAGSMGLDGLARGNNAPESQLDDGQTQQSRQGARPQRADDGSLDIADMGDRSDGFSGADLGGFEQPSPQNDQDYNYAAAAEHQPKSVPYPDGGPQFVGTLWALGQPQSLTQARYNPLPDKGTYQDYPAYKSGGNDFSAVASVVDETPRARRPGPGRYSLPSPNALAPEHRPDQSGQQYDYARGPLTSAAASNSDGFSSSSLSREFDDDDGVNDDFVD